MTVDQRWTEWEPVHITPELIKSLKDNIDRLEDVIKDLTYKPGWRFKVRHDDLTRVQFVITAAVRDSRYPESDEPFEVTHARPVEPFPIPDPVRWIFDKIVDVERHEAMEYFKINGEPPYYPHRDTRQNPYIVTEAPLHGM